MSQKKNRRYEVDVIGSLTPSEAPILEVDEYGLAIYTLAGKSYITDIQALELLRWDLNNWQRDNQCEKTLSLIVRCGKHKGHAGPHQSISRVPGEEESHVTWIDVPGSSL